MNARAVLLTLASGFALLPPVAGWSQDFRVDTDVFLNDAQEPVSETLTLFAGDVVYDFILSGPEEITIFDVARGRIVLLDGTRSVKTTLTTEQLLQLTAAMKTVSGAEQRQGLLNPQFATRFEEATGQLELTSANLVYRAKGIPPKTDTAAQRFQQFADWYARLNAVRPGNLPPFGRIELNRLLAEHRLVPEEIERTLIVDGALGDQHHRARSRHTFIWTLSSTDRKRMERASRLQSAFPAVSAAEYWQTARLASKAR